MFEANFEMMSGVEILDFVISIFYVKLAQSSVLLEPDLDLERRVHAPYQLVNNEPHALTSSWASPTSPSWASPEFYMCWTAR